MKKTLLILCALLLTSIGATADDESYKFVNTDWVGVDYRSADEDQVTYGTDGSNTITVTATGANNIALQNLISSDTYSTAGYTVSGWQHWFIVVGTNLSTTASDSKLWWMNGANNGGEWEPTNVVTLSDGPVLLAWDLSLMPAIDRNLHNDENYLDGYICFGLTSTDETDHKSVISDIGFYTLEEAIAAYPSLSGQLTETTKPYEFKADDWVALSDHTGTSATPDTDGNTIKVTYSTGNEAGLGNGNDSYNTANYYVTEEQKWFVIQGKGLSTSGHLLWWMNGYNDGGSYAPTEAVTLDGGVVVLAWDLSKCLGNYMLGKKNTLNGLTCFGLIAEDTSEGFTITDISFYTEADVEELIATAITPYEFNASDWVALSDHSGTNVTPDTDGNTISVTYTGSEAGLSNSETANSGSDYNTTLGITTGKYTVTKDQCWFVVIGEGLSTTSDDHHIWWMNGANWGEWTPTKVVELDDDQVLIAWDLSTMSEIDVNLQDESDLLDGWIAFGLKAANHSNGGSFTISDINFYTKTQVDALVGIEWEMTDAGWGTLILPFAASIPTDEDGEAALTLYAGSALELSNDGTTITVGDASESIAANTPYLVSGTEGKYTFTGTYVEAENGLSDENGMLTGTFVDMDCDALLAAAGESNTVYVLQKQSGDESPAFYPVVAPDESGNENSKDTTLEPYHCYLTLDNSTSGSGVRAFISLPGTDDEATRIVAVESEEESADAGAIYDLSGRQVSKAVKGVYIQNGKKVLVK